MSRTESTAATRARLLRTATDLLASEGDDAVTLRAVGARAGVSHSALYRHFADKDALLTAVATAAWDEFADGLADPSAAHSPAASVRGALERFAELARRSPSLYRLMFRRTGPDLAPVVEAAGRAQDAFLELVGRLVAGDPAPYGALLLAAAHGVADLEQAGQLDPAKWHAEPASLLDLLVTLLHTQHAEDGRVL